MKRSTSIRNTICLGFAAALAAMPLTLAACDKTVSKSKTETTKKEQTPAGEKTTTETHEKKVEEQKK